MIDQRVNERTIGEAGAKPTRIDPPAFPLVGRANSDEGREVIAVSVGRGQAGPHMMYCGRTYPRVGNTAVEMCADKYQPMLFERMHGERR